MNTPPDTRPAGMGSDQMHEREYESAKDTAGRPDLPLWADLTEAQREVIREENRSYWQELRDFGAGLFAQAQTAAPIEAGGEGEGEP